MTFNNREISKNQPSILQEFLLWKKLGWHMELYTEIAFKDKCLTVVLNFDIP